MKCEYCGGTLSLENEYCPYCGRPNEHARKHIEDMRHYDSVYEETKGDVYAVTKNYAEVSIRVVALAVILILIFVFIWIGGNAYSVRRNIGARYAAVRHKAYTEQMEEYLENKEFRDFSAFCSRHQISGYGYDSKHHEYESYIPLIHAANDYSNICQNIMNYTDMEEEYATDLYVGNIADFIGHFYDTMSLERYTYIDNLDTEKTVRIMKDMESDIQALLRTYCHFTEEEAASLESMSRAKIAMLIEEGEKVEN